MITKEPPEFENQNAPDNVQIPKLISRKQSTKDRSSGPIEVITVDPQQALTPDGPEVAPSSADRVGRI